MASSKMLPSSCAAHRTALLSGLFEIATVAGDATLMERRRHGPPRRAGTCTDTRGTTAGYAACDRRSRNEEERSTTDRQDKHERNKLRGHNTSHRKDEGAP